MRSRSRWRRKKGVKNEDEEEEIEKIQEEHKDGKAKGKRG